MIPFHKYSIRDRLREQEKKQNRRTRNKLLWIAAGIVLVVFLWLHIYVEPYEESGTCIDKFITHDRYAHPEYHVVFRYADRVMDETKQVDGYYHYNIGTTYTFERTKFIWK